MNQAPLYDAIIFDLDGTLVDTAPTLHLATNHVLEQIGRQPVELAAIYNAISFGAKTIIEKALLNTGGINGEDIGALHRNFLEFYQSNIALGSRPFDHARDLLEHLKSNSVRLGVCTNKTHMLAVKLLEELEIAHYFDAITGGDTFSFKKPDPRHVDETLKITGPFKRAMMVGDSSPDIKAAKALNITSVAITHGYSDIDLAELEPTYLINHLSELEKILQA